MRIIRQWRSPDSPTRTREYVHIVSGDGPQLKYTGPDPKPKIFHATSGEQSHGEIDRTPSLLEVCAVPGPVVLIPTINKGVKQFTIEFTVENMSPSEASVEVSIGCTINPFEQGSLNIIEEVFNGTTLDKFTVPSNHSKQLQTSVIASMDQLRAPILARSPISPISPASLSSLSVSTGSQVGIVLDFDTPLGNGETISSRSATAWEAQGNFHSSSSPQECTQVMHLLRIGDRVFKIDDVFGNDSSNNKGEDDEEDDNNDLCAVCLVSPRNTALLPCRHLSFCIKCAQQLHMRRDSCPICRTNIQQIVAQKKD